MISAIVYMLCALTSALCTALLSRNYRRHRSRLLLWSGICFFGLAINNALLFVDLVLAPQIDLAVVRTIPAVVGLGALLWGFIWESP